MPNNRLLNETAGLRFLIGLAMVIGILYFAKPFLVPVALSILLTFILSPIVNKFQSLGLPRVPATILTSGLAMALSLAVGWVVWTQVNNLAGELTQHKEKFKTRLVDVRNSFASGPFSRLFEMMGELEQATKQQDPSTPPPVPSQEVVVRREEASRLEKLVQFTVPVLEPLTVAGFVIFTVIFMLIGREDLRNRIIGLIGHGHLTGTTRALVDATQRLSRYLLTLLVVNAGFGLVFSLGLWLAGVPYAFLWGFLMGMLRFVPYIGTWVGASFPFFLSLALSTDWTQPLLVVGLIMLLDIISVNILEPLWFGHSTGVTPIALLIAAAFWTWIWGPVGLILSTPMTVCLVVLGQHTSSFRFVTMLLGDRPALEPRVKYYQRLIANDVNEAQQIAAEHVKQQGLLAAGDQVILAGLALARRDRRHQGLTAEEEQNVLAATKQIAQELTARPSGASVAAEAGSSAAAHRVIACAAHHEGEEIGLLILAAALREHAIHLEIASTQLLPIDIEDMVATQQPAAVFISVLPPGGLAQARYLCHRLRRHFKRLPIVVGYTSPDVNFDRLLGVMRAAGASYVTTSLAQARTQLVALLASHPDIDAAPQTVPAPSGPAAPQLQAEPTGVA